MEITININNLVGEMRISTEQMTISVDKIKAEVTAALLNAIEQAKFNASNLESAQTRGAICWNVDSIRKRF